MPRLLPLGLLPFALIAFAHAGDGPTPAGWPQYGGPTADFRATIAAVGLPADPAKVLWRRPLGPGESGIVSDGRWLYTAYSVPVPPKNETGDEVIVCLDPATGKTRWEHKYPVARLPKQETFRGAPVGPQATPAVADGRVFLVGYAGVLTCLAADTGKVVWTRDLVKDFEATPVQFGFAASPVVAGGRLIVGVGGKQAAVIAFDPTDGTVKWKSAAAEPGYATPVVARLGGEEQIVHLTRDAVFGFAAADGTTRWTYTLPKPGLTNVPTPLPLPDDRVLVAGQGQDGTALLQVTRGKDGFAVKRVWQTTRAKFFYCTWVRVGDVVYGYGASRFLGLRWSDGEVLWESDGLNEGNVIAGETAALVLRGDGRLTLGRLSAEGYDETAKLQLFDGRCWIAPTVLDGVLFARTPKEIAAVPLGAK